MMARRSGETDHRDYGDEWPGPRASEDAHPSTNRPAPTLVGRPDRKVTVALPTDAHALRLTIVRLEDENTILRRDLGIAWRMIGRLEDERARRTAKPVRWYHAALAALLCRTDDLAAFLDRHEFIGSALGYLGAIVLALAAIAAARMLGGL